MFLIPKLKNCIFSLKKRLFGFPHPTRAVRVKYRQGAIIQSKSGDLLQLVQVENTCYIYSIELNEILGELEPVLCKKLIKIFGKGFCLDGKILGIAGGPPYAYYGLVLEIYDTKTYLAEIEDFSPFYT